jgi:ABC-type phosphate transport system substrate-binding protein
MQKPFRPIRLVVFAVLAAAPCFAHHMAVVVSKQTGVTTISSVQLGRIFRGETKKWPDGKSIQLVLHRSSTGESETLERLNRMSAEQWHNWVAEHKDSLVFADSDEEVLNYVENTPAAVGLVEVHSVNDHVVVVRVDGKLPMEDGYLPH